MSIPALKRPPRRLGDDLGESRLTDHRAAVRGAILRAGIALVAALLLVAACSAERAYPTSRDAVAAECAALCSWYESCNAAVDEPKCVRGCAALQCSGANCDLPPRGEDEAIDACAATMASAMCDAQPMTDACFHAMRP